uniref:Solute carrier family 40 member n=1 Tax=Acrobeloides nanus TaxID=290746 RepID=A0A914EPA5_9BILA
MIKTYAKQEVAAASFGLALLYMTVLSFDGVAISYGKTQGLPEDFIGAVRSLTAIIAMSAAVIYRFLVKCIGVRFTGLIGLTVISGSAFLCSLSAFLPGSPFGAIEYFTELTLETWYGNFKNALQHAPINSTATPVYQLIDIDWPTMTVNGKSMLSVLTFFLGLIIARLGYWISYLCITQQMQETIPSHIRGTVSGVQGSLQSFFSVTKDILLILLPDPKLFGLLILASTFCHFGGLLSYCYYLLQTISKHTTSEATIEETAVKLSSKIEDSYEESTLVRDSFKIKA